MTTPVLPITRQVNHLVYTSSALSLAILLCSLVNLGGSSLWLSEAGVLFTIIHHAIVVHDRRKQKKPSEGGSDISLHFPLSARKAMIFLAVFISVVYTAALAINILFTVFTFSDGVGSDWNRLWVASLIEMICLVVEVPVMLMIALRSMKERRVVLGVGETGK